jgi:hypothetical protein
MREQNGKCETLSSSPSTAKKKKFSNMGLLKVLLCVKTILNWSLTILQLLGKDTVTLSF